jgi:hypothetical protein
MESPSIQIQVVKKIGKEYYGPKDKNAEELLKLMKQSTFTAENLSYLKSCGWSMSYAYEKPSMFLDSLGIKKIK